MISAEEFVERLCLVGADRGPRRFPRRKRDREILIKSITMQMDSVLEYTEPEINELLKRWKRDIAPAVDTDHVTIRRLLVDQGHLERTADGARYRRGFGARPVAFALEVDELDLQATVAAFLDHVARKRQAADRQPAVGSEQHDD